MSIFRTARRPLAALFALVALALAGAAQAATLRVATLAPKASIWGATLQTFADAVAAKTGGAVTVTVFFNAAQGDEGVMVGKMKSGLLEGALVTDVGLGKVYKPVLALELPGLFRTWAHVDAARSAMEPSFKQGMADAGFLLGGWVDVGTSRMYSKGFAPATPEALRGRKPFNWRDGSHEQAICQAIGSVTPVPANIPEVLPNLNTGAIDMFRAPALVAETFQWSTKVDTVVDEPVNLVLGGLVFKKAAIEALPADQQTIVLDVAKTAAGSLRARVRSADDAAWTKHKGNHTVVTLTADQRAAWSTIWQQARARLGQGIYSPDLIAQLEAMPH